MEKRTAQMGDYVKAFMEMFGGARPYVTKRSCKNQFYSDLITPLPDKIDVRALKSIFSMHSKWAKSTVSAMNGILPIW